MCPSSPIPLLRGASRAHMAMLGLYWSCPKQLDGSSWLPLQCCQTKDHYSENLRVVDRKTTTRQAQWPSRAITTTAHDALLILSVSLLKLLQTAFVYKLFYQIQVMLIIKQSQQKCALHKGSQGTRKLPPKSPKALVGCIPESWNQEGESTGCYVNENQRCFA